VDGAIEGPYLIYHPDIKKYYLFVSYDSLFEDYNVRVGRADSITGPFLDYHGRDLDDCTHMPQFEIGNKIMGGYRFCEGEGWIAPGHNSVLKDKDNYFILHHARPERDMKWCYLHVRKMLWTNDGWPVVSPERYAGEELQNIPMDCIAGTWEIIVHSPEINGQVVAQTHELLKNGKMGNEDNKDNWRFDGCFTLTLEQYDKDGELLSEAKVLLLPSWDWELNRTTLVFTGMNSTGICIWGKKMND